MDGDRGAEVSVRCAHKWVGRCRAEGELGLHDRSSALRSIPHRAGQQRVAVIAALRRLRFTGPEIAETLGMAVATVSGILTRIGMGRLGLEPAQRYERDHPGELVPSDVKKLGRIVDGAGYRHTGRRHHIADRTDREGKRRRTRGGSTSTSGSMTALAWPTPRSSQTRPPHCRRIPAPSEPVLRLPRHHVQAVLSAA